FKWSDFVLAMNRALGEGEQYFTLRITATLAGDGEEPVTLTDECRLPVAPVLERIQRAGLELTWVAIPCGFPAPAFIEPTTVETVADDDGEPRMEQVPETPPERTGATLAD